MPAWPFVPAPALEPAAPVVPAPPLVPAPPFVPAAPAAPAEPVVLLPAAPVIPPSGDWVTLPQAATVHQGQAIARPSHLGLAVDADRTIRVSGLVVDLGGGELEL